MMDLYQASRADLLRTVLGQRETIARQALLPAPGSGADDVAIRAGGAGRCGGGVAASAPPPQSARPDLVTP